MREVNLRRRNMQDIMDNELQIGKWNALSLLRPDELDILVGVLRSDRMSITAIRR